MRVHFGGCSPSRGLSELKHSQRRLHQEFEGDLARPQLAGLRGPDVEDDGGKSLEGCAFRCRAAGNTAIKNRTQRWLDSRCYIR